VDLVDDEGDFPWWCQLVAVCVALDPLEHQVPDLKLPTLDVAGVVPPHGMLVPYHVDQGDVVSFAKLVDDILEGNLVPFVGIGLDPWTTVVKVGWEDRF
jgi:hypothetical protein